jgi:trk system potassium uptake protein TrkH
MVEKIVPRIKETAKILFVTYSIITVVMLIILYALGMPLFEAACYALGLVSTGGFSDTNDSVMSLAPAIRIALAFLSVLSGLRMDIYYSAYKERSLKPIWDNEETRVYLLMTCGTVLVTFAVLWRSGLKIANAFIESSVQITSAITSTGFVSTDYTAWPPFGQLLVLMLPFIGACAGSTGGGLKVGRLLILFKGIRTTLTRIRHPKAIIKLHISDRVVSPEVVSNTQGFLFIYILVTLLSTAIFCLAGYDMQMSFSIVGACINNVGTAFSKAGPLTNYMDLPVWSMYFLPVLMLFGRLEAYTLLILFSRDSWAGK